MRMSSPSGVLEGTKFQVGGGGGGSKRSIYLCLLFEAFIAFPFMPRGPSRQLTIKQSNQFKQNLK